MSFDNTEFQIDNSTDPDYWNTASAQYCLSTPKKFRDFLFRYRIGEAITHAYPAVSWNERFAVDYETKIIQGISFVSDEESQMGKGTIYATTRYNKNDPMDDFTRKPRYDYIYLQYEGEDDSYPTLARVMLIIEIENLCEKSDDDESMIMLLVQLLQKCENTRGEIQIGDNMLGDLYKWSTTGGGRHTLTEYVYDVVAVQSVIRPAFVIPIFREGYNILRPNELDRFMVLDRKFFDRSGWGLVNTSNVVVDSPTEQTDYLFRNQTAASMLNARLGSSVKENTINSEDDENEEDNEEVEEMYSCCSSSDDD